MSRTLTRIAATFLALLLLAVCASDSRSCGPFFPPTVLGAREETLLHSPLGDFIVEIDRIKSQTRPAFKARMPDKDSSPIKQTADADVADLSAELTRLRWPSRDAVLAAYAGVREVLRSHQEDLETWRSQRWWWAKPGMPEYRPEPKLPPLAVPAGLPGEFEDYLRGAIAYRQGKAPEARAAWEKLLARPAKDRPARSVWAAYMMSNVFDGDNEACIKWCEKTRDLVQAGFADSLGLAAASYGQQGQAELGDRHFVRAIELYLVQRDSGDRSAYMSLRDTVHQLVAAGADAMKQAAVNPLARQVVTAYLLTRGGPWRDIDDKEQQALKAWFAALEAADAKDVELADRIAWAAYSSGDYAAAQRWADRAKKDSAIAHWVRAKLLLRAGKLDQAAELLAKVVREIPTSEVWWRPERGGVYHGWGDPIEQELPQHHVAAELAILRLARQQYVQALDLLLKADWWEDAAYVAERVVTLDELKAYVDKEWPKAPAKLFKSQMVLDKEGRFVKEIVVTPAQARENQALRIRWLLGRRLVRDGRGREAGKYLPPPFGEKLDKYLAGLARGHDAKSPAEDRGRALWSAAKLARYSGMELMGTELGPDGFIWKGAYALAASGEDTYNPGGEHKATLAGLRTRDEAARASRLPATPNTRFHYRPIAIDLAWEAATLLPDESDETAEALYEGGQWLAHRDAKAADKFYKALVKRCGQTKLGAAAAAAHWFPPPKAEKQ